MLNTFKTEYFSRSKTIKTLNTLCDVLGNVNCVLTDGGDVELYNRNIQKINLPQKIGVSPSSRRLGTALLILAGILGFSSTLLFFGGALCMPLIGLPLVALGVAGLATAYWLAKKGECMQIPDRHRVSSEKLSKAMHGLFSAKKPEVNTTVTVDHKQTKNLVK